MAATLKEIKKAFYRATMTALGYDPETVYKKTKPPVRFISSALGNPDWSINDDVLFITIRDSGGDDVSQPVHEFWENDGEDLRRKHFATRVLEVIFTAYGPNGYDKLIQLRHSLFDGSSILRKEKIYIIPTADTPQYVTELFQSMWFERTDLTLHFNNELFFDEKIRSIREVNGDIHANPAGNSKNIISSGNMIIKKG